MSAPAISVITAAYNGAGVIGETIASVLGQSMPDWEMVIVDDGSTDGTRELLAAYDDPRLRVHHAAQNGGPVLARNQAVALARGRYLAALDQDDLCHPERFARQLAYLDRHPDVVAVGSAVEHLEGGRTVPGFLAAPTCPSLIRWLLLLRNPIAWSSMMIRGTAARALAPFSRQERLFAEDFDLYHRIAQLGEIARIDEPLLLYRVHAGGVSVRHKSRMHESTTLVLADAYSAPLKAYAPEAAALVARHFAAAETVPDEPTMAALSAIVERLHGWFVAAHGPDGEALEMIAAQTSRMWWTLVSRAVRGGTVPLADALALRPTPIRDAEHDPGAFLASRVIGTGRTLMGRNG